MTWKWKNNEKVKSVIKQSVLSEPPKVYVEKLERWCPYNNAETIGVKNNINKYFNKPQSQFLYKFLQEKLLDEFDIKLLIQALNGYYITDGSLQRKILSTFVCLGVIEKKEIKYKNKRGEEKIKFVYKLNRDTNSKSCPYLTDKGCKYEWKKARETKYFDKSQEGVS